MPAVIPGVTLLTSPPGVNMVLIEDPDGLTLIDTSLKLGARQVLAVLKRLGRQPADLRRILITHAHLDHIGGLPLLKAATGAVVIASAPERADIEQRQRVPVDRTLTDDETLPEVLGGLQAVLAPGHTRGHLAFWQPERRLLVCGDVIMNLAGLTLPFAFVTVDMAENRRSAARLAALEPAIVLFGHGPALTRDAAAALRRFAGRAAPAG